MENQQKHEKYKAYEGKILDDRYVIESMIGAGGMAVVFKARDKCLNNMPVAIKILKDDAASDPVTVKRFKNESRAGMMLKHTNVVGVYNVSTKGEIKYMVMEYVYGITLKSYMVAKCAPLEFKELMSYTTQILKGLGEAHRNQIIHRDIKPQNIMVLKNGQIKVMDFGIAKLPDAETITVAEKAIGTVYYMSPEQASGKKNIDRRTDIYSLGAMMYELATGTTPFKGETYMNVLVKHITDEPTPPRQINSSIPIGLEQIIMCAMSKDPNSRFQTVEEMLSYVKRLQANKKIKFEDLPCNTLVQNLWARIKSIFKKK